MDSNEKKVCWVVGEIAMFIIAVLVVSAVWHNMIVKTYVSAGYNRTTLPGASCTYWVKDGKDNQNAKPK